MAKTKISKKRARSSAVTPSDVLSPVKLKEGMKLKRHEPGKVMRDASFVRAALNEALAEGDMEAFKEILRGHYEALNITQALEKANVSRRTYYEAVSPRGNPRLSTVMRLMKGLEA